MIISLLFAYLQGCFLLCTIFSAEFVMNYVAAAFSVASERSGRVNFFTISFMFVLLWLWDRTSFAEWWLNAKKKKNSVLSSASIFPLNVSFFTSEFGHEWFTFGWSYTTALVHPHSQMSVILEKMASHFFIVVLSNLLMVKGVLSEFLSANTFPHY